MGFAFNYYPHASQSGVHLDRGIRFRAICAGRRWGKTRFAAAELLDVAGERGGLYAWIAPTYYIAERGENAIKLIGGDFVQLRGQNPVRATRRRFAKAVNGFSKVVGKKRWKRKSETIAETTIIARMETELAG